MPRGNRHQPIVSCLECRRMKWKCDREFPCENCKKRGIAFLCPGGKLEPNGRNSTTITNEMLQKRIEELEAALKLAQEQAGPSVSRPARIPQAQEHVPASSSRVFESQLGDELHSDYGQLILGDQPGDSRFFAQMPPTYLHAANENRSTEIPIEGFEDMRILLPAKEEAENLARVYFEIGSYNNCIITRETFAEYLDAVYAGRRSDVLAIVLLIIAIGAQMDPVKALYNDFSERLFRSARHALVRDQSCSIEMIQSILLMSRFIANSDDAAKSCPGFWGTLGTAMRTAQQLGLHRDGSRWGLPEVDAEPRRRTFWETYTEDVLQCVTQGRPRMFCDWTIDTAYPLVTGDPDSLFHDYKYRYVRLLAKINDLQCRIDPVRYSEVMDIDKELRDVDATIPPVLRYEEGNPASDRHVRNDLQRLILKLFHAEALFFLHRNPFAQALREFPQDPLKTSLHYIVELEASRQLIQVVRDAITLNSELMFRYWSFYFHAFNGLVTLAAAIAKGPGHLLAPTLLKHLESGCEAFHVVPNDHVVVKLQPLVDRLLSAAQDNIITRTEGPGETIQLLGVGSTLHRMPRASSQQQQQQQQQPSTEPGVTLAAADPWNGQDLALDIFATGPPSPSGLGAELPSDNNFDALRGFFDVDAFMQEFGLLAEQPDQS